MITGDYLRDVPLPHVRKWPDSRDRRYVSVNVGSFVVGIHCHVSIKEDHNPIWDSREKRNRPDEPTGWRECWDDADGGGKNFCEIFDLRCQADDYVERIVTEHFPPETHDVCVNAVDVSEYFYRREGD